MTKQNDEKTQMWDNWMYDGKKKKKYSREAGEERLDRRAIWRGLRHTGQGKTLLQFQIQMYLVALRSLSCMQQNPVNSLFIFILIQVFSNSLCYGFLDTPNIQ